MTVFPRFCDWVIISHQLSFLLSEFLIASIHDSLCPRCLWILIRSSMYYHFAILLLFRPLIKLRIIGSAILPRDVCSQAADAIQGLLRSYSQLYTLHRTPSFVPYFLLTSSIMHLAIGASEIESLSPAAQSNASTVRPDDDHTSSDDPVSSPAAGGSAEPTSSPSSSATTRLSLKVTTAIKQGIADLAEMAPCHHFAEQALNILRFLARRWNIEVDIPYQGAQEEVDRLLRSSTNSLNFFIPNVSTEDFMANWPERKRQRHASRAPPPTHGGMERMQRTIAEDYVNPDRQTTPPPVLGHAAATSNMAENPLFWPFPMQGRPMLPEGPQLEEAGFRLL